MSAKLWCVCGHDRFMHMRADGPDGVHGKCMLCDCRAFKLPEKPAVREKIEER